MRFCRFKTNDQPVRFGVIESDSIVPIDGSPLEKWKKSGTAVPLTQAKLCAPIAPSNLIAIGRNYLEHAKEGNDDAPKAPIVFLKATTSITDPGAPIVLPEMAPNEVDYEAELAVIIGKTARNVSESEALRFVFGYTCANDVSARDCQRNDPQWARGKSFDTFAPLGPWIETDPQTQQFADFTETERPHDAGLEHVDDDFSGAIPDQLSFALHDPPAGHGDPDRNAGGVRFRAEAAGVAQAE